MQKSACRGHTTVQNNCLPRWHFVELTKNPYRIVFSENNICIRCILFYHSLSAMTPFALGTLTVNIQHVPF